MALNSTLGSPGIEIREIDNSVRIDTNTSTTVFVPGFAAQGPVEEVLSIGSIQDFELIYGKPTNGAERYFYYTVKALLDKGGSGIRVLTSRLPYGAGAGDYVSDAYTLLAYPAVPVIKSDSGRDTDCFITEDDELPDDQFKLYSKVTTTNYDADNKKLSEKLTSNTIVANLNSDESAYEIFIEEDYLKKYGISFNSDDKKLTVSWEGTEVPGITDTEATTPILSVKLPNDEILTSDGHIATELKNGRFIVHLIYSLKDERETSPVGHISFTLIYILKDNGEFDPSSLHHETEISNPVGEDNFPLLDNEQTVVKQIITNQVVFGDSTIDTIFSSAYEIAASYDGQSEEQLGNWDITEQYKEDEHGDTDDVELVENTSKFSKDVTYLVGAPATFHISLKDYYNIITGDFINWSRRPYGFTDSSRMVYESSTDINGSESRFGLIEALGHSAFIAINTSRTSVNENFEGYYLGLNDNMFVTPSDDYIFNAVTGVKVTTKSYLTKNADNETGDLEIGIIDSVNPTYGDYDTIGNQRLTFKLDSNNQGSISRVMSRNITSKDISTTDFDDTLSLGLFKLSKTTDTNDILKLSYSIREKYNWSFAKNRLKSSSDSTKPVSYFVDNIMSSSKNITIMMNPYISEKDFLTHDGVFHGKIRIFGDKLSKTLDKYEDKYLRRNYTAISNTSTNKGLITPIKLAASNILSYKEMIKQAGVTPNLLKSNFKASVTENDSENYKTFAPINSLYPFGVYTTALTSQKIIGQVPTKLRRALELVENDEEYPDIDLLVEGGLGTIYINSNGNDISGEYASRSLIVAEPSKDPDPIKDEQATRETTFDESLILTGIEDMRTSRSSLSEQAQEIIEDYLAVTNVFLQFANSMQNGGRGDTFYISDIPRGILIKGKDTKVSNLYGIEIENNAYNFGEKVVHSFPTSIFYPIKHQFDNVVSTYASTYAQWVKINDEFSGDKVWIPISGHIGALIASTDAVYGPWYASAGLRRGVISDVLDYALSPTISQRTDLYKICINSVPKIPNYGVTVWGIRTMSKKDSAFDQNTCRRTFLYMEKKIKQLLRYYIFEPNNSYTRLQIFNDIDPFLEGIKNKGGIYNYTLVTDTTVNTPEIINNGDLVVAIGAAPTRTAENIIVEFTANKYTEEISASESMQ